jgi:aryl-alcohol dehydrogenase-like predicted oxidoreductase
MRASGRMVAAISRETIVPMEKRRLGQSSLQVSVVGLGANNFGGRMDLAATRRVVDKALDLGITLVDTADTYGGNGASEDFLGQILRSRCKDVVLATKFGIEMNGAPAGASRGYIMRAVEGSLKRLRTDWIDLYQLHRPDPKTPIEETLRALDDLVRRGKVRAIGCSNLSTPELDAAQECAERHGLARFVCCQDHYSLLARRIERDLVPAMTAHGLGLLPYFPLASGLLTGKYRRGAPAPKNARLAASRYGDRFMSEQNWQIVGKLEEFAAGRGRTLLELAFGWLLGKPMLASVIAGATSAEQVEANVRAAFWRLSDDEMAAVDRISASALNRP